MAEINKDDIFQAISKLEMVGKVLPGSDAIKHSNDPDGEHKRVLGLQIQVWWDAFAWKHIDREKWHMAIKAALSVPGYFANPEVMQKALTIVENKLQDEAAEEYAEKERQKYIGKMELTDEQRWIKKYMCSQMLSYSQTRQHRSLSKARALKLSDFSSQGRNIGQRLGMSPEDVELQLPILCVYVTEYFRAKELGVKPVCKIWFDAELGVAKIAAV